MSLADLNQKERGVVSECLRAALEGTFFPDWEFSTLFGLTRDEVRRVLSSWPHPDEDDENVVRAIDNSMNNLLRYPHRSDRKTWFDFISVDPSELAEILAKWKRKSPHDPYTGRTWLENSMQRFTLLQPTPAIATSANRKAKLK